MYDLHTVENMPYLNAKKKKEIEMLKTTLT